MGQRLAEYYKQAQAMGGLKAQMRLAILTLLPSAKAAAVPDTADVIGKFEAAMAELRKEFR